MLAVKQVSGRNYIQAIIKVQKMTYSTLEEEEAAGKFRVLQLIPKKPERKTKSMAKRELLPARETRMPYNQDWPSVWPGPRTFHPDSVPLPLRQGFPKKNDVPPKKHANTELMKIPNFLHLTPSAIIKHCEAIKKFCTKWPVELETQEDFDKHFPLEVITSDYCYSSPSIRDPLARIVSIRVKLSSLSLDSHAKDKLLRLVAERYDKDTDYITIVVDRCPMRKQNLEYAQYLLTAVYNESKKIEAWESEKSLVDMEIYDWDMNRSRKSLVTLHAWPEPPKDDDYNNIPHATEYKIAVSDLINNGENEYSLNKYKECVKKVLNLKN